MAAIQSQLNSELFGALQVIAEDEGLMKKAVRSLKRIASQKKTMESTNRPMDETEYLMSSPAMAEILKQGQEDLRQGKGKVVKLDDLWK